MWGVQSAAVERPAHTALLQSIWNHPAGKKGQKLQFERPPRTPNLQLQFGPIFSLGMYLLREGGGHKETVLLCCQGSFTQLSSDLS